MKIKLDDHALAPIRAHRTDAGIDLRAPLRFTLRTGEATIIDTGVHIAIPEGYVGFLKSKSGLNINHGITGEGVIDSGYTGSVRVKLSNNGAEDYQFKRGDKIIQLVILPVLIPTLELVNELDETERGDNGFGSTGR